MSRSTRVYDRVYKRPAYLALGVEEMWRVDPIERMVLTSRGGEAPDRPWRNEVEWKPSLLGVTLTVPLSRVFRGLSEQTETTTQPQVDR
jgi:Uma2 family endonuclease